MIRSSLCIAGARSVWQGARQLPSLVAVAGWLAALASPMVLRGVEPATNDLWDVSHGVVVTATSGTYSASDPRDMFGGEFSSVEPGQTLFSDAQLEGFVHFVEWQTPQPVSLKSFRLFAAGDGPEFNNEREFAQFTLKAKSSATSGYDLVLYSFTPAHPYDFVDAVNKEVLAADLPAVTAQFFRAEFVQYNGHRSFDGPRIIEMDGFSEPLALVNDGIPDSWKRQYFGADYANDPRAAATADPDGDGANNYQEYLAGTNPLDATSVLTVPLFVRTYAGSVAGGQDGPRTNATLTAPSSLAFDPSGRVWITESTFADVETVIAGAHRIRVLDGNQLRTVAGAVEPGLVEGLGLAARFAGPHKVAVDSHGNAFVADQANHRIRKIDPNGVVSTFAGSQAGFQDGVGANAMFHSPIWVVADASDNLYVADFDNLCIRKITPQAVVTTYAGGSARGAADGPLATATFDSPNGLALGPDGSLFVSDWQNGKIRRISGGMVTTLASGPTYLDGINCDAQGNVYAAFNGAHYLAKYSPAGALLWTIPTGQGFQDGPIEVAQFSGAVGAPLPAPDGNLLVYDVFNNRIRQIAVGPPPLFEIAPAPSSFTNSMSIVLNSFVSGAVIHFTLNGSEPDADSPAYTGPILIQDTTTLKARLFQNGLPISDILTSTFSKAITPPAELLPVQVSTFAGTGVDGAQDGFRTLATFSHAASLTLAKDGRIFMTEANIPTFTTVGFGGQSIRVIGLDGTVSTFAGSDEPGLVEGPRLSARFRGPNALVFDHSGNMFISDRLNHRIRKIDQNGIVSTFAGSIAGYSDGVGTNAMLNSPVGLCIDQNDNLYVADFYNIVVRKITPDAEVTTYAGIGLNRGTQDGFRTAATFNSPHWVACSAQGDVYVADWLNGEIRKISADGTVSTFASGLANIEAVAVDKDGGVYASLPSGHFIKFHPNGTVAWSMDNPPGFQDGPISVAQFLHYSPPVFLPNGDLLMADGTRIRLIEMEPKPCAGAPSGLVAWWPGEGSANDVVQGQNGTLLGGSRFQTGKVGQAFAFDGIDGRVKVPASGPLDLGAGDGLTIEAWINPSDITAQHPIVEWNSGTAYGSHFYISTVPPAGGGVGCLYANLVDTAQGNHVITSQGGVIRTNTFQHVAVTYDKGSGLASLYLDGELLAQQNLGSFVPETRFDLFLGYRPPGFDGSPFAFAGLMDEVSLYNHALSDGEIQSIFNAGAAGKCQSVPVNAGPPALTLQPLAQTVQLGGAVTLTVAAQGSAPLIYQWLHNGVAIPGATGPSLTLAVVRSADAGSYSVQVSNSLGSITSAAVQLTITPLSGLAAYWTFDEASGVTAHDVVAAHDGTLVGGAKFVQGGISGNALSLDRASDSSVNLGDVLGLTDTSFSIVAWIKMNAGDSSENSLVIAKHEAGYNNGYFLNVNRSAARGADNKAMFFACGPLSVPVSTTSVNDGAWHQVVAVHEVGGNDSLYVDGSPAEAVMPSYPVLPSPAPLMIGGASFNGVPQGLFTGLIDDVQIYTRTLSPAEVDLLYSLPGQPVPRYAVVTTLAGSGNPGRQDGPGLAASFNAPNGGFVGPDRCAYVADTRNHLIRRVDLRTAQVTTVAGTGTAGYQDGPAQQAMFSSPLSTFVDSAGNVYVADTDNNRIRKITAGLNPVVTTVAGSGSSGYLDGPAATARFNFPNDLTMDAAGNLYVSEFNNHTIRKISSDGTVSTFAGNGTPGFADGLGVAAGFNQPAGLAIDRSGNLFVTEWGSHRIRRVSPTGLVTTAAGSVFPGWADGQGLQARFFEPDGIVVDSFGTIFVTEHGNNDIRRISADGAVTTVAGRVAPGYADGPAATAQFNGPGGIGLDTTGNLVVADTGNHRIRLISFLAAPQVTVNPASQTALTGTDVQFTASTTGDGPFAFQWKFNGGDIPGASNAVLTLRNVSPANAGQYVVVVTTPVSSIQSAPVALSVLRLVEYDRQLPVYYGPGTTLTVVLQMAPGVAPGATYAYAVQDSPPTGWSIGNISDGGSFDPATQMVKFGPFFDFTHQTLSYDVTPPAGETGTRSFQGTVSASGQAFPVGGTNTILPGPMHPADLSPADFRMTINEVTSYATAWRVGKSWSLDPNPIPIAYVTRAGLLWKNGEVYQFNPQAGGAPLWWVPRSVVSPNFQIRAARSAPTPDTGVAQATLPSAFVPGEPFQVQVQVAPAASVAAYAVEEQVAAGVSVSAISDGGAYDAANQLVKWGPFFDNTPRQLSFTATSLALPPASVSFTGEASFDGVDSAIGGATTIRAAIRLSGLKLLPQGQFGLSIQPADGQTYSIETSSDLRSWLPLTSAQNSTGVLRFSDPDALHAPQRFYRAVGQDP